MFSTFISWIWIGISSFLVGYFILNVLSKILGKSTGVDSIDLDIVYGLCFLTVYSQFFSLFYRVSLLANMIILCCDIAIIYAYRKQLRIILGNVFKKEYRSFLRIVVFVTVICLCVVVILASAPIRHYDTDLYHAQSIRWIEEYGIVPGLGNLHNRLAYNSSLFSLQALFSMKWLFDRSMHSVNGFIICFFLIHAILSMRVFKERKIYVSDFFRVSMIAFCNLESTYECISSPGSDLLAIGLFIYILEKVVVLVEDNCKDIEPYAILCILSVFAFTVKLSVAMLVLFTIIPLYYIIREKKWKDMFIYLTTGLIVVLPFLIRNVIISGYLIYPYPSIDLFNVDWKMPQYTLQFDSNEIKAWGWGLRDVMLFDTPINEWFPVWYEKLTSEGEILFKLNIVLLVAGVVWSMCRIVHQKYKEVCVFMVIVANLLLWFGGAPLPRYGMPFMLLLPFGAMGILFKKIIVKQHNILPIGIMLICMIIAFPSVHYACQCLRNGDAPELVCRDYKEYECVENIWEGEIIYSPKEYDQAGYYYFPSTPYAKRLKLIELRGENLTDGFRMKEQYRNAYVSTYGNVETENMFEIE